VQPSVYVANTRPYRPAYPFQNGLAGSLYRRHNFWGGYAPANIIYHSAGKFLPSVRNIAAPSIDINANPASVGHITPLSSSYHSIRSLVTPTGTLNEIPASAGHKSPQSIPSVRKIVASTGILNFIDAVPSKPHLAKVGELPAQKAEMHPMSGSIFFNDADESQIIVRGFYYSQPGPDAFFWAGEDEPSCSEQSVGGRNYLLAPGQVGSTDYYNEAQPILPAYHGDQGDLVLTLPAGASTRNLKWICVWCRKFAANFGTLKINSP